LRSISVRGRRTRSLVAVALAATIGIGAVASPAAAGTKPAKPAKVKVMSRNLYLGADLVPAIVAPTPAAARTAAGKIYKSVQDTNFIARAKLLAQEIENSNADLIGLQEVALWRRGQRGAADGPETPAEEVVYDFLDILQNELGKRGLAYDVVSLQQEADIELPTDIDGDGEAEFDGRLTMRDVILAKEGVTTKNAQQANYEAKLVVPTQLGQVEVLRGWNAVDVKVAHRNRKPTRFRFVNTHLESFFNVTRTQQAIELIGSSGAVDTNKPVILVGDLNSDPDAAASEDAAAYNVIVGQEEPTDGGFADRGVEVNTCCFGSDLLDPPPAEFTSRIDHVLSRGDVTELDADLIGDDPALRTGTGLWPTDHGGVVAKLKVR